MVILRDLLHGFFWVLDFRSGVFWYFVVLIKYQFSASDSLEEVLDDQELNLVIFRDFGMWVFYIFWSWSTIISGHMIFFGGFFFFLDDQELNLVILRGFYYWVLPGFGFSEVGFWYFVALIIIQLRASEILGYCSSI